MVLGGQLLGWYRAMPQTVDYHDTAVLGTDCLKAEGPGCERGRLALARDSRWLEGVSMPQTA